MTDADLDYAPTPINAGSVDRRRYLPERARGRRVVHLGCVDEHHYEDRADRGALLHGQLAATASELTGVDLSADGLAAMAATIPGRYVHGDVEELADLPLPEACDLVIAGEIIEHVPNPGRFLRSLETYLARTGATALITTPNSYSWLGFARFALSRRERTHPDHLLVHSPATLVRSLEAAGLEVVSLRAHRWDVGRGLRQRVRGAVDALVLRWDPWLCVGFVAEVRSPSGPVGRGAATVSTTIQP